MAHRIQLRGGTASAAVSANPVLRSREIGIETDSGLFKVGNGSDPYNDLPYGGLHGETGNYFEFRFLNLEAQPPAPTGDQPVGWNTYPSTPVYPENTWVTVGEKNSDNILQTLWSTPSRMSGLKGDIGETGATGAKGDVGTTADPWTLVGSWDTDEAVVKDGIVWISLQDTNIGNDPIITENIWWKRWPGQDSVIAVQGIAQYGDEPSKYHRDMMPEGMVILPLDGRLSSLDGSVTTVADAEVVYDSTVKKFYDASLFGTDPGDYVKEQASFTSVTMTDKCRGAVVWMYLDSTDDSAAVDIFGINAFNNAVLLRIASLGQGVLSDITFTVGDGVATDGFSHSVQPLEGWHCIACWWNPGEAKLYGALDGVVESISTTISGAYSNDITVSSYGANDVYGLSFHTQEAGYFIRDTDITMAEQTRMLDHYTSSAAWAPAEYFDYIHIFENLNIDGGAVAGQITHPDGTPATALAKGMTIVDTNINDDDPLLDSNGNVWSYLLTWILFKDLTPKFTGVNYASAPGAAYAYGAIESIERTPVLGVFDGSEDVQVFGLWARPFVPASKDGLQLFYGEEGDWTGDDAQKLYIDIYGPSIYFEHRFVNGILTRGQLSYITSGNWIYVYVFVNGLTGEVGISVDGVVTSQIITGARPLEDYENVSTVVVAPNITFPIKNGNETSSETNDICEPFYWRGSVADFSHDDFEDYRLRNVSRFSDPTETIPADFYINGPAAGNIVLDRPLITWGGAQTGNSDEVVSISQVEALLVPKVTATSGTAFPASPVFAEECYRTDTLNWYKWNGTTWTQI